jgi:multidrug resistance efflux pump
MSTPQQPAAAPQPANNGKRKRMMTLLVIVILIAAIAYGLYYFLIARFHEETDDAYVNGNVVQITPQVTGTVISVNADDTQTVKTGDPVVVLDRPIRASRFSRPKRISRRSCARCAASSPTTASTLRRSPCASRICRARRTI